jgi:hypothetical protein
MFFLAGLDMTRITLDATVAVQLKDLTGPVELCDPTGRVMGRFVPIIDMTQWEPVSPEVSEDELERREKEAESYSTAEVLAFLENLKCTGSDGKAPL